MEQKVNNHFFNDFYKAIELKGMKTLNFLVAELHKIMKNKKNLSHKTRKLPLWKILVNYLLYSVSCALIIKRHPEAAHNGVNYCSAAGGFCF